jgi:hypothetical protein
MWRANAAPHQPLTMNKTSLLVITTLGAVLTFSARADFFENFDSYTTGSLNGQGGWVVDTGTLNVTSADSVSAANSVVWSSSAGTRAHIGLGANSQMASQVDWSFNFKDVGGTRDYNQIYAYSSGWTGGLQADLAFGDYNTGTTGYYMGRYPIATTAGAVYSDGATLGATTGGWFTLGIGGGNGVEVKRSNGWHLFEVKGSVYNNTPGLAQLQFFVDNNLVGTVGNVTDYNLTWACVGSAVSAGVTGGNTDNIRVTAVPEPSSLALGVLGACGLAAARFARRRIA